MGQKVNPKGFRLHQIQNTKHIKKITPIKNWQPTLFQGYINKITFKHKHHLALVLENMLKFYFFKKKAYIHHVFVKETHFGFIATVHYFSSGDSFNHFFFQYFTKHFELSFSQKKPIFFILKKNKLLKDQMNYVSNKNSDLIQLLNEGNSIFISKSLALLLKNMVEASIKHQQVFDIFSQTVEIAFFSGKLNVKGIKVQIKGRIGGVDRSRKMQVSFGAVSIQTLDTFVDYSFEKALTPYGVLGLKIWVAYK